MIDSSPIRIMVLDGGKLAEMDSAANLLKLEDGVFKALWERHQSSHGGSAVDASEVVGEETGEVNEL
jgi:hypothetical protein